MNFSELRKLIKDEAENNNFQCASDRIQEEIFNLSREDFIPLITEIGSIPEDVEHDSREEKLYTKVSDIILAKCFIELGLKATVLKERSNCADIIARSVFHNYSLVADAKSFRLSRTAKNQKDFKVESMLYWKGDNNFSILCCPYFQYPKTKSQIFGQALNGNVLLFSWEYFTLLLNKGICETSSINLSDLWNWSYNLSTTTTVQNKNICFLEQQNEYLRNFLNISEDELNACFKSFKQNIILRGEKEILYWQDKINYIQNCSKDEAIKLLIKSLKLNEKICSINNYINRLRG